jgi:hypothetical protein
MHTEEVVVVPMMVLVEEYSEPQFRHWDWAFRLCERGNLGVPVLVDGKDETAGVTFLFDDEGVP